ncbi:putative RDD family membrane protein YckC [Evansella vedderi]|uniref:RDD family membrane protein YckC n=1 Tax=Evansella vedderi TaxID=38282 RepID=A0ABT9ZYN0_9BACI|nr:RDD family protein [Evansella vedderi]MDQ0255806.1 putative RDD family membrane protein YckC [Evansella vedderi]
MEDKWVKKMLDERYYAGFSQRVIAFFYDMFSLLVVLCLVGSVSTWWVVSRSNAPDDATLTQLMDYIYEYEFHLVIINTVVLSLTAIVFHFILPAFKRQTIGMKMVGLYLLDENANEITKGQYLKRELLKLVLFPTLFMLLIGKGKRPLYDRMTGVYLLE